jgi:voltage-gated potassium channel
MLRLWSIVVDEKYGSLGPVKGRLRYMITFHALVDLAAIVPFYVSYGVDLKIR